MSTTNPHHDGSVNHPDLTATSLETKRKISPSAEGDQPVAKRLRSAPVSTNDVSSEGADLAATPAQDSSTDATDRSSIGHSSTTSSRPSTATRPSSIDSSPTRASHCAGTGTPDRLQLQKELDPSYDFSDLSEPDTFEATLKSTIPSALPQPESSVDDAAPVVPAQLQQIGQPAAGVPNDVSGSAENTEVYVRRSARTTRPPARFLDGLQHTVGQTGSLAPPRPKNKTTGPVSPEPETQSVHGESADPKADGVGESAEEAGPTPSVIAVKSRAPRATAKKATVKDALSSELSSVSSIRPHGAAEHDSMQIDDAPADDESAPPTKTAPTRKRTVKTTTTKRAPVKRAPANKGVTKPRATRNATLPPAFQTKTTVRGRKMASSIAPEPMDTDDAEYNPDVDIDADADVEPDAIDFTQDMPTVVPGQAPNVQSSGTSRPKTSRECLFTVDPKLINISKEMVTRLGDDRPLTPGEPPVWADSRQALYETCNYFKKPQGGSHTNDRHVYGLLTDGERRNNEYMDAEVIIRRAGGSMSKDSDGEMRQGKDHSATSADNRSILNDIAHANPIVFIIGNDDTGHPCQMPQRYCVLGWYKPIMIWAEKVQGRGGKTFVTFKQRFERLNDPDWPLWHASQESVVTCDEQVGGLKTHDCGSCKKTWPQIYLEGWICLSSECELFWKIGSDDAPLTNLHYNPAFLLHRTPWADESAPYDLVRPIPDVGQLVGENLVYVNTRGVICPKCGRCNSRYLWTGWRCDNPVCDWVHNVKHQALHPQSLQSHTPWGVIGDGSSLARNKYEEAFGVSVQISYLFGYKVAKYTIKGVKGCFVHAIANEQLNRQAGGPNDMFIDLQQKDFGLERRRFAVEKFGGKTKSTSKKLFTLDEEDAEELERGDFMSAFSTNYGMPYKFVASGASQPFENGPEAIRACRSQLNWAAETFLDDKIFEAGTVTRYDTPSKTYKPDRTDFNELLIFGYMEKQKIDYHDDGEEGLGPCIASLSLGGKAEMSLRVKAKHFSGISKSNILTADKPIPVYKDEAMYKKRLAAWEQMQTMDGKAANDYRKTIAKKLGLPTKSKASPELITVTLGHGDIMLMEGYEIQQYLEHKVVPEGLLRFALTCRTVLPGHLTPAEQPQYLVSPDEYGYNGPGVEVEKKNAAGSASRPAGEVPLVWHVEDPGMMG